MFIWVDMQSIFRSFFFRLIAGLLLVCVLPALVLPEWRGAWRGSLLHEVSLTTVAVAFIASMFSMQRFDWFPGTRSIFAGLTIVIGWYALLGAFLMAVRLPYSLSYIWLGFILSLGFMLVQSSWFRHHHVLRMGFVPVGRAEHLDDVHGVEWIRLEEPALPENDRKLNAIVADLHAPTLTSTWQKFLADCTLQHMPVYNIRQVEEALTGRVKIHHMYENNLGSLLPNPIYMALKYLWEGGLIVLSLPIVLPLMLLTALLIKLEDGGSVFYNQERVGYRGKPFLMYKFRSMTENRKLNQETTTAHNDARVTRIGRFIRKVRIDELPQFLNVALGQMSLIGPRAEYKKFADELEQQVPFYQYRHIVKPGITGWAQVRHGYATGADETQVKIEHDFYYIKNFSFSLDVLIVFLTIRTMLTGFGAR